MDVFLSWLITELPQLFLSGHCKLCMLQKAHIYWQTLLLQFTFLSLLYSLTPLRLAARLNLRYVEDATSSFSKSSFWELDSKKLFQEMISYTFAAALLQGKDEVVQIQSRIQTLFTAFLHTYNKTWSYSMRNLRVLNLSFESYNYTQMYISG